MMGELSLDGSILPLKGALPMAMMAKECGFEGFLLPAENAREAAVVEGLQVYGVHTIREVVDFLNDERALQPTKVDLEEEFQRENRSFPLIAEVKGQENVKRASWRWPRQGA